MSDPVNSPDHYQTDSGLEAISVIEAFFKDNYHLGNAFKYLARAGKKTKDPGEDLRKAVWYIQRYLKLLQSTLTPEQREAIALLEISGVEVPDSDRLAYEDTFGDLWVLQSNGQWSRDAVPRPIDTQTVILSVQIFGTKIVGV